MTCMSQIVLHFVLIKNKGHKVVTDRIDSKCLQERQFSLDFLNTSLRGECIMENV